MQRTRGHLRAVLALGLVCATAVFVGCPAGGDSPRAGGSGGTPAGGTGGAPGAGTGGTPGGGTGGAPGGGTGGAAGCAAGTTLCTGVCRSLMSDGANCGTCGKVCATGTVCNQGLCSTGGCATALTLCGSSCVDIMGSQGNCGACGKACPADQSCWLGGCRCVTGSAVCDGICKDVTSSTVNCGTCGNVCATGATCVAGVCQCPVAQLACSGVCKAVNTDGQNCGKCGVVCGAGTSCLFGACLDPASVACNPKAQASTTSTAFAAIPLGQYWLNNNLWGRATGSGTQSIWSTCQQGDLVGWGTSWNWTGTANAVKSYASSVFGWHWGTMVPNTGMPVQISSGKKINCGWDFTVTQTGGALDVSYDIFAHTIPNAGSTNDPTDEIMIWLYAANGAAPTGTKQATVSLDGTSWDLYRGVINNQGTGALLWNVFSYVRTANATTAVLNIMDFANDLVTRGWMQSSKYLSGVESGTEVFTGVGQLNTNGYYCRIQ